uniref:F-box protein n=1 Tax=Chenopodium quinoa TaxID=63459 RepID=A0A803N3T7_CHEQI
MLNYVEYCDVWTMKEYNRPATWTKMFSFPKQQMIGDFRPLSFSTSRKQLFLTYTSYVLASLDMKTLETTIVKLSGFPRVLCAHLSQDNLHMFKDAEDVLASRQQRKKNSKRQRLMRRTERKAKTE